MLCKAFKFGRLATSQFETKQQLLNDFLASVEVHGLPQVTACDEDGPVMFVFYTDKSSVLNKSVTESVSINKSSKA